VRAGLVLREGGRKGGREGGEGGGGRGREWRKGEAFPSFACSLEGALKIALQLE